MLSSLTLVSVLYGADDVTARCLATWTPLMETQGGPHLVVVDNSPDDGNQKVLADRGWLDHPRVTCLRRVDNPGFAEAVDTAAQLCRTRWMLIINPDIAFGPDIADSLTDCLALVGDRHDRAVALSTVTGGVEHCGIRLTRYGFFADRGVDDPKPCLGPSGGAALVETETFLRLGAFLPSLFAWGEDADLALRLYQDGIETVCHRSALSHVGGHSVASLAGRRFKAHLLARNRVLVLRRCSPALARLLMPVLLAASAANAVRCVGTRTLGPRARGLWHGLTIAVEQPPAAQRFTLRSFVAYHRTRGVPT